MGKWGVHEVMGLHGGGTSKDSVTSAKQLVVREKVCSAKVVHEISLAMLTLCFS